MSGSRAEKASPRELGGIFASVARSLALENTLDIRAIARLNHQRFGVRELAAAWDGLRRGIRGFVAESRSSDYPVRMLRNELPTRTITSSTDATFSVFAADLLKALTTSDERLAYWYERRLVVYKAFVDLPFIGGPGTLSALRHTLMDLTRAPLAAQVTTAREAKVRSHHNEEKPMGATFDLMGPESLKRSIFQYWVYNTDTDEIAAEGSFIAKGDTLAEATRHLMDGLRSRLAPQLTPSLKVHVKMIDQFTKDVGKNSKTLAEQFVDAVRDEIRREAKT